MGGRHTGTYWNADLGLRLVGPFLSVQGLEWAEELEGRLPTL